MQAMKETEVRADRVSLPEWLRVDLRSTARKCAWARTPQLTEACSGLFSDLFSATLCCSRVHSTLCTFCYTLLDSSSVYALELTLYIQNYYTLYCSLLLELMSHRSRAQAAQGTLFQCVWVPCNVVFLYVMNTGAL